MKKKDVVRYKEEIKEDNPLDYINYYVNSKITYEKESDHLYEFKGTLELVGIDIPLTIKNVLLRGSVLRNTDYVYGAVIYTGSRTKIKMQKKLKFKVKHSKLERKTFYALIFVLIIQLIFCLTAALYHVIYLIIHKSKFAAWVDFSSSNIASLFF